ncbi:MAG: hypothetical protein WC635_15680 [Bacteriovorax sp.]|jgi:hypothetical protein
MNLKIFFLLICFSAISVESYAADLEQVVSGAEVEDVLGTMKSTGSSPYIIEDTTESVVDKQKSQEGVHPDFNFNSNLKEVSVKNDSRTKYEDVGYTSPGTFEKSENYLENDKTEMAKDFRKYSSGGMNITFIKDNFSYESNNDIINRTISEGYKHVKGGTLHFRSDQYFYRTDLFNTFWSLGAGIGYNSGRGIFLATGERSDTTFKLWEVPVDLGIGLEVPISQWFKISGAVGPSVMTLFQNRNDLERGEDGKNKMQVSYGQFANAQLKVNLSGFNSDTAYDLFTESKITNLFLNLEARYQNYQNFQDEIKISGTSFGIGFTFEYL